MPSLRERLREYCERYRAARIIETPTAKRLRKVQVALFLSWILIPTLIIAGNFSLVAAIFAVIVTLAIPAKLFIHLKTLGLTAKSSPIRSDSIAMIVFAVALVAFALTSIVVTGELHNTGKDIQTTNPETVFCFGQFTTPASVYAPQLNAEFVRDVDRDLKSQMRRKHYYHDEQDELSISFEPDADFHLGCVLTNSSIAPKNQGENLPIKFNGKSGRLIQRILSVIPVPYYPLSTIDNAQSDNVYVCTPGVYDFVSGMTSYTEADPIPVCIDSRLPIIVSLTVTKFVMHSITALLLFVYLGLSTSVANKAKHLVKASYIPIAYDADHIRPPEYTAPNGAEPLIQGDVKA